MVMSLLLVVQAITFSLTVNRFGTNITLRYPVAEKVDLIEVCVEAEGIDEQHPSSAHWYQNECWAPRFNVEQFTLRAGTVHVRAHLTLSESSHREKLSTPVWQVRPEPETP